VLTKISTAGLMVMVTISATKTNVAALHRFLRRFAQRKARRARHGGLEMCG
jgi:hypothetical protein